MNRPIAFSIATLHGPNSISRSLLRRGIPALLFMLALFALLPTARPLTPPPDGGYQGGNTAEGVLALSSLPDSGFGAYNTAVGWSALTKLTTGNHNTAVGTVSLSSLVSGSYNVAVGDFALLSNQTASYNTAVGYHALHYNGADSNTAIGDHSLFFNYAGTQNTATGAQALDRNNANNNTATGFAALFSNSNGAANTATGVDSLYSNVSGYFNTASGFFALYENYGGVQNTATGAGALQSNTTASNNTATGYDSLFYNTTGAGNTAEGYQALLHSTGSNNIALGSNAGINLTTGSNNIDIGALGAAAEANTIRIGKQGAQKSTFIAGISGVAVTGSAVVVTATGKLGVAVSSARFKEAIKPMDKASEAILALKPVTFRYKEELDPDKIPQFGLVAEQVEKINPDLVARDEDGKVNTVRYEAVNAMLLNEFLKEHHKVEEQGATIAKQQKQIEALTAGLQKVTARVEAANPVPRVASDN